MAKQKPKTIRTMFETIYTESIPNNDIEYLIHLLHPFEYSYIYHDCDTYPSGEVKKPHYHLYCKWLLPQQHDDVLSKLGLNSQHIISTARNKRAVHQYMLHLTPDAKREHKFVYSKDRIKSNIEFLDELLKNEVDIKYDNFKIIYTLLNDLASGNITFPQFFLVLNDQDLLDFYNKYYNSVFRRLLPMDIQ